MECELLALETSHGTLHGMSFGSGERLVIHFHGTWGNFYENPFIASLAQAYSNHQVRFASVNLPSHDGGSINEKMPESIDAIKAWISALAGDNAPVVLQGHSLGALKLIELLRQENSALNQQVIGAILLSPFDIVQFYGGTCDEERSRKRALVNELINKNGPLSLVSPEIFDLWPIASDLFLRVTEPGSEWDLFPSRDTEKCRQLLAEIPVPTLMVLGNDDFASNPKSSIVAQELTGIDQLSIELIDNAPHNFAGQENVLSEKVTKFLTKLR